MDDRDERRTSPATHRQQGNERLHGVHLRHAALDIVVERHVLENLQCANLALDLVRFKQIHQHIQAAD